jgi:hypothetical protein
VSPGQRRRRSRSVRTSRYAQTTFMMRVSCLSAKKVQKRPRRNRLAVLLGALRFASALFKPPPLPSPPRSGASHGLSRLLSSPSATSALHLQHDRPARFAPSNPWGFSERAVNWGRAAAWVEGVCTMPTPHMRVCGDRTAIVPCSILGRRREPHQGQLTGGRRFPLQRHAELQWQPAGPPNR